MWITDDIGGSRFQGFAILYSFGVLHEHGRFRRRASGFPSTETAKLCSALRSSLASIFALMIRGASARSTALTLLGNLRTAQNAVGNHGNTPAASVGGKSSPAPVTKAVVFFFRLLHGLAGESARTLSGVSGVRLSAGDAALRPAVALFLVVARGFLTSQGFWNFVHAQKFTPSSVAEQPVLVHWQAGFKSSKCLHG
jgi:hypothetical protein